MLQLRPTCECCQTPLPPESREARICSFECTFCARCAEATFGGACPNCGGELVRRPIRPAGKLAANPASTERVHRPHGGRCGPAAAVPSPPTAAAMPDDRVFEAARHFREGATEPPRIVITESEHAALVAWSVEPGQRIALHLHPTGQDTWVVLAGEGLYFTDREETARPLKPGSVAVAPAGAVHGALNTGTERLRFVSVVSPALSGFEPA